MSTLSPAELKQLAKEVVDLEKEALYGEGDSEAQRLNRIEKLIIDETREAEQE
jgi:hypothetical protein